MPSNSSTIGVISYSNSPASDDGTESDGFCSLLSKLFSFLEHCLNVQRNTVSSTTSLSAMEEIRQIIQRLKVVLKPYDRSAIDTVVSGVLNMKGITKLFRVEKENQGQLYFHGAIHLSGQLTGRGMRFTFFELLYDPGILVYNLKSL